MVKSWHIWDFPNNLYVLLKKDVHNKFFNKMFKKFGTRKKYVRFLKKNIKEIHKRHYNLRRKRKNNYHKFIPIKILKISSKFLNQKLKKEIEKSIIALKSKYGQKMVELKLPIKESSKLYRILAHLIADGSGGGKHHEPYYCNSCKTLRKQFKKDLRILGDIKIRIENLNPTPAIIFPKTITYILEHIFKIKFTNPNKIPQKVFNSQLEHKKEFLKAIYDDEGTVSPHLTINMKCLNVVKEIKKLLTSLNIQSSKIVRKTNPNETWSFSVFKKEYKKFHKIVGFYHPSKVNNLINIIKIQKKKYRYDTNFKLYIYKKIIRLLKKKDYTTLKMSHILLLNYYTTLRRLTYLANKNLIKKKGNKNRYLWSLF